MSNIIPNIMPNIMPNIPVEIKKVFLEILLKRKYDTIEEFNKIISDQNEIDKIQTELQYISKQEYWGRITWTFFLFF